MATTILPSPQKRTADGDLATKRSILSRLSEDPNPDLEEWQKRIHTLTIENVASTRDTASQYMRAHLPETQGKEAEEYEDILGWWQGNIISVHAKTFEAELQDLDGRQSIAVIEKKSAGHAQQGEIRQGARFIYYVSRVERIDGAKTQSSIQFLPPYLHSERDKEVIKRRMAQLFEE